MSSNSVEDAQAAAFIAWISTFNLSRPVSSLSDLNDGSALFDVLTVVDPEYFARPVTSSSSSALQQPDNWPLRFTSLKRLFRLITQYFVEVLHQSTSTVKSLDVPDLQKIAREGDAKETLVLCRLCIAIAVMSKHNAETIGGIQSLKEVHQQRLMEAIALVMSKLEPVPNDDAGDTTHMTEDDHYYEMHLERSRVLFDKDTVEKAYNTLVEEHQNLQSNYEDAIAEKAELVAQLNQARREVESMQGENISSKGDVMKRAEIDRLRTELQKSEDNLNAAEAEAERQAAIIADLNKKNDELQAQADEADHLKDKLDEFKHAAEKLSKMENVMEKYKKKLEESADLRRKVKSLEEQNARLVDTNAQLDAEFSKVASFKPLVDSYKTQLGELENKAASRAKEVESLKWELEQTKGKLKQAMEQQAKDAEAIELYQDRVKELELGATPNRPNFKGGVRDSIVLGTGGLEDELRGLGGELDDALSGTTTTDLKLQVRKLEKELEELRGAKGKEEESKILVLESLLEDAKRLKGRYEADYLKEHREKLVLLSEMEEIRAGRGDGGEAAIALRQRLNETVEELDALKKEHTELEVKFERANRDLTIAKSDLNLVNKDQVEILHSLRETLNQDKEALEAEIASLRNQLSEVSDKNKMHLEQVNTLLMEKVSMQTDGLGQRERMLERERELGDLRMVLAGKDIPEDVKAKMMALHEDAESVKEQLKVANDKLAKARQFIKSQDKLFREEHAKALNNLAGGQFDEAEESFRSQIKILEEEITRLKRLMAEAELRYRREQELMLGHIHAQGMAITKQHLAAQQKGAGGGGPSSWLGQQRKNLGQSLRR
ncbi:Protein Hook homolog 3 Short=h-hook3; Short=hHK3 [Serendipita indica DSM 11827]|nr:Protein Hook homolog 3 Short=h-hook3; Short=hHK3 [Serendipita indica DSM 11827]